MNELNKDMFTNKLQNISVLMSTELRLKLNATNAFL